MKIGNIINGKLIIPDNVEVGKVYNPSRGEIIAEVPMSGFNEVDAAVQAAAEAYRSWSTLPSPRRASIMFEFKRQLETHFDEVARLITQENGKTLEEARGDVRRGIEVVDFACGVAHLTKGECLPQVANEIDAVTMREPIGVCVGITPFNFPAMVPMWMFPLAIACGNTFVLKPSEKVPLTAMRLAELFYEADLPPGVLNIVNGGAETVTALCSHPEVAAVSFVGSSRVAETIFKLATANGKRCQAAGGANNVLLVMPDADEESTLRAILGSAYGCAGQRCMAGSVFMGIGDDTADSWRERVKTALAQLKVDDTSANDASEMGPVIDRNSQNRINLIVEKASEVGVEIAYQGSTFPKQGFFVGPTLLDHVRPETSLFQNEIFGPVLSMVRCESLKSAIGIMNQVQFGNGASIFTNDGGAARQFTREMQCGMIGVNVGVPAPMALFAFSGWNASFYGDLHMQGKEGVMFYTRQRVVLSRWDNKYARNQGW